MLLLAPNNLKKPKSGGQKWKLTEDRVVGVHGDLVLGGVADEPLRVGERHVRRRRSVALGRKSTSVASFVKIRHLIDYTLASTFIIILERRNPMFRADK